MLGSENLIKSFLSKILPDVNRIEFHSLRTTVSSTTKSNWKLLFSSYSVQKTPSSSITYIFVLFFNKKSTWKSSFKRFFLRLKLKEKTVLFTPSVDVSRLDFQVFPWKRFIQPSCNPKNIIVNKHFIRFDSCYRRIY